MAEPEPETSRNRQSTPKKTLQQRNELPKSDRPKHRAQKYRPDWELLSTFKNWLKPGPDEYKAKCCVCDSILTAEVGVLKAHANRQKHIDAMKKLPSTNKQASVMASYVVKKDPQLVKTAEVKLSAFLVEHNLSFKAIDHMTELIKDIFPDSKTAQQISLKRTKATAIATAVIGETEKEALVTKLKQTKFSVISDESTDISTQKSSCIVVRFYDDTPKQIVSKFWELSKIFDSSNPDLANEGATGKNLFNSLIKSFEKESVPLTNLIGYAADGCSVMMGENNSVASRLKESLPGITIIKCVCHSAHLCASQACKELPRRCEDLAREIYGFFKCSSKRQCQFAEFQSFLNLKPHKMLHPSQTRWLSLVAVVDRLLEQWDALKLFFTNTYLSEKLIATDIILNTLNDPLMKMYYNFLAWILPKFTEFNKYFQSESVMITSLNDKVREIYRDILLCFLNRDYVMRQELENINFENPENWLRNEQLYLGVRVMNDLKNPEVTRSKVELIYKYKFWSALYQCEDYRELSQFALNTLCIPNSNAQCERVFSKVNLMKTKIRNKLSTETVNGTLLVAQQVKANGSCIDFKPSPEMLSKLNLSMYKRANIAPTTADDSHRSLIKY